MKQLLSLTFLVFFGFTIAQINPNDIVINNKAKKAEKTKEYSRDRLDDYKLKRFYFDISHSAITDFSDTWFHKIAGYRMGNYFYFKRNMDVRFFAKLQWFQMGIQPYGLFIDPLHLGFGVNRMINENNFILFNISGGVSFNTDDVLNPDIDRWYNLYADIRYASNRWNLGIELFPQFNGLLNEHSKDPFGLAGCHVGINVGCYF